jgi:hypothetical protein
MQICLSLLLLLLLLLLLPPACARPMHDASYASLGKATHAMLSGGGGGAAAAASSLAG